MSAPATIALLLTLASAGISPAAAQVRGVVEGRVVRQDGTPLSGVTVLLKASGAVTWTGADGTYRFEQVAAGPLTLLLSLGGYSMELSGEVPADGGLTLPDASADWPLSFAETILVGAASRQVESITDAPASVVAIDAAQIARLAGQGQLPALLSGAAGVQAPQSGLYDFNVNARGFNDLVNRRVRVEVDGRDGSQPSVSGNTDWASLSQALDEFEQVEFVRGPGGALYGQGALNGVLSLRSKDPASSLGGRARVTLGELGTQRFDARHAGALGSGWYFKALGGYLRSDDFAVSRVDSVEYEPGLLPQEAIAIPEDRLTIAYVSGRLDKHVSAASTLAMEGGWTYKEGPVTVSSLGRYQSLDMRFPWARAEYRLPDWRVSGAFTGQDINDQVSLASGTNVYLSSSNVQLDAQTARTFLATRGRLIAGGSYNRQTADSADPTGRQTALPAPQTVDNGAIYGQADYDATDRLKLSAAARVDWTTITRTTFSPRFAAIWEAAPGHRLRAAYSDAFKAPSIVEARLYSEIAPPLDLSALESALAPVLGGTPLGFGSVPLLAVGNPTVEPEHVRSVEFGYGGTIGQRTFVQAAVYHTWHDSFSSGLLPQVGTSLGRLNPEYGPYQTPAGLSPAASAIVQASLAQVLPSSLYASMSNSTTTGAPIFVVLSSGNFGEARTAGIELSSMTLLPAGWRIDLGYSWFTEDIEVNSPETPLAANTPAHQASAGVIYTAPRFDVGGRIRLVGHIDWVSGVFAGPVPGYAVVDAQGTVKLSTRFRAGVDVSNLFDNDHYEMFGGDLLGRRALAHLTVGW
jgi:outer membrane receptor protein involved in Fe transport